MAGLTRRALLLAILAGMAHPAFAAEEVVVTDGTGTETPLAELIDGHPTVLHLWATWCAPCLEELPKLAAMLDANPDLADHVVVLSVDSAPFEVVDLFLRERLGLSLHTLKVVKGNPGLAFALMGYPSTLLIDSDGVVVDRETGSVDWSSPKTVARIRAHVTPR